MSGRKPVSAEIPGAIVLFDGVCNLCNGAVRFIVRRDRQRHFRYASLQGETGRILLSRHFPEPGGAPDSIILIEDGKAYVRSEAVLRILRRLGPYRMIVPALRLIPLPLRDFLYRLIAGNRYRLFGKRDRCMIPSSGTKSLFMD